MFQDTRDHGFCSAHFGKTRLVDDLAADDFEALRAHMPSAGGRAARQRDTRISVFKYGLDNGLIEKPVRYGGEFRKPDKAVLRRHRAQNGEDAGGRPTAVGLIDAAPVPLARWSCSASNAGFGNHDIATLPCRPLDLDAGWVDFRSKDRHRAAVSAVAGDRDRDREALARGRSEG